MQIFKVLAHEPGVKLSFVLTDLNDISLFSTLYLINYSGEVVHE